MRLVVARQVEDGLEKVRETVAAADARDIHGAAKVGVVVEDLDVDVVVLHDHGGLDGAVDRAVEVVAAATLVVAVKGRLHALVTRSEDLEDIEFATASGPARAISAAVLESAGDLSVEHPDSGHVNGVVDVLGSLTVIGHLELEEEGLLGTGETVVGNSTRTGVATAVALALLVGHDDDLVGGTNLAVLKNLRGRATALAVSTRVGKRVAEGVVKDTRARATIVVQEDKAISIARLGVVVSLTAPRAAGRRAEDIVKNSAAGGASRGGSRGGSRSRGLSRGGSLRARIRTGVGLVLDRRSGGGSGARVVVGPTDGLAVNGGVDHVADGSLGLTLVGVGVSVRMTTSSSGTALGVGRAAGSVDGELLQLGGTTDVHGDLEMVSDARVATCVALSCAVRGDQCCIPPHRAGSWSQSNRKESSRKSQSRHPSW
jgi:hypothetical protein